MTPAETRHVVEAYGHDRRQWNIHLAWWTQNMDRQGKNFKPLDEYIGEKRPTEQMPAEDMMANIRALKQRRKEAAEKEAKREARRAAEAEAARNGS